MSNSTHAYKHSEPLQSLDKTLIGLIYADRSLVFGRGNLVALSAYRMNEAGPLSPPCGTPTDIHPAAVKGFSQVSYMSTERNRSIIGRPINFSGVCALLLVGRLHERGILNSLMNFRWKTSMSLHLFCVVLELTGHVKKNVYVCRSHCQL